MMSVFTSDVTHPQIIYYINEKENAIAPKVTEKGASAVQQQVNDTFIETVSKQRWRQFSLSAMLLMMKMIRSWQTNCQKP